MKRRSTSFRGWYGFDFEVKRARFKRLPLMNVMWRPLLMALHSASNIDGILLDVSAARANLLER